MRTLLAYLPTYPSSATLQFTATVASVAKRLGATVQAMTTEPVFKDSSHWALRDTLNAMINEAESIAHERGRVLGESMDAEAGTSGVGLKRVTIQGEQADFVRHMRRSSSVHDLTMIELRAYDPVRDVAKAVIFGSGRPLLVLPVDATTVFAPERIVVAWDGSAAAARALGDALPWFDGATSIEIVTVDEAEKTDAGATAEHAAGYLNAQGHAASALALKRVDRAVDNVLFDHALATKADLVVMGAYGHSRLREFVLGGVTRRALTEPRIPMLMAH